MTSYKQKICALLVLSLFLLSVIPMGLADEESGNVLNVQVDAEVELDSDAADVEVNSESKTEVETEENDSEVEEKGEVKTKVKNGSLNKGMRINKEVKELRVGLQKARERLEEAKEKYKEAMENQRENRQKVLDLSKELKRCNTNKKDCAALRVNLKTGVKNHLLKSVQVVERSLEKLTKTVEKIEDLSEEEKGYALDLIADLNAELEAQKAKINAFTPETSPEEIRAAIKDLKELNQKVHKMQRRLVGLLVNSKLYVLVQKHAEIRTGMQARIDVLAATGADVSELEATLAEFDAKVEELKQDYETAKQKWMEAKDAEDFDQFNRDLREAQHEVRKDLQEIKEILRKFLKEHKEIKEGSEETSDEENESEEAESNTSLEVNASTEAAA